MTGRIFSLSISNGGVPKHPIREGVVNELGIEGDAHKQVKFHGGPTRALCIFSLDLLEKLQGEGHPIFPGSTGENVLISGIDWSTLAAGTRLALGDEVEIELTKVADPCKTIRDSFVGGHFKRLEADGEMRWYCKVLRGGTLKVAQTVRVQP